jgi:hypothetical protein
MVRLGEARVSKEVSESKPKEKREGTNPRSRIVGRYRE